MQTCIDLVDCVCVCAVVVLCLPSPCTHKQTNKQTIIEIASATDRKSECVSLQSYTRICLYTIHLLPVFVNNIAQHKTKFKKCMTCSHLNELFQCQIIHLDSSSRTHTHKTHDILSKTWRSPTHIAHRWIPNMFACSAGHVEWVCFVVAQSHTLARCPINFIYL